jgi:uncharacterized MnhB-related membrane protein
MVVLVMVAAAGLAVVLTRDPRIQALVTAFYGLLLALLFLLFRAPEAALAEVLAGVVALPVLILLALARIRDREAGE